MNILREIWGTILLFLASNMAVGLMFDMSDIAKTGNLVGDLVLKMYFAPAILVNNLWRDR